MIYVLPVETYVREIAWKSHFACYLLERDPAGTVYIAETSKAVKIACKAGANAVFIGKHIHSLFPQKSADYFVALDASGCRIVFVEEEGGVYLTGDPVRDKSKWEYRCPYDIIGIDKFDTVHWGQYQYDLTRSIFGGDRHFVGGSPAVDSCIITSDASKKQTTGTQKSFNSSIGVVSKGGLGAYFESITGYYSYFLSAISWQNSKATENFYETRANIIRAELDMFREFQLISGAGVSNNAWQVRLHPSMSSFMPLEVPASVRFSDSLRIPINTFLQDKALVIHNGCTSAVQSFYMGIPTISTSDSPDNLLRDHLAAPDRIKLYGQIGLSLDALEGVQYSQPMPSELLFALFANKKFQLRAFAVLADIVLGNSLHRLSSSKSLTTLIDAWLLASSFLYQVKSYRRFSAHNKFASIAFLDVVRYVNEYSLCYPMPQSYDVTSLGPLAAKVVVRASV
jgi:surface carbohydrate biosynthesis protein